MTFAFQKERMTAVNDDGTPVGHITFPRIRPGLVNIDQLTMFPQFRSPELADQMMEALLTYLDSQNQKAALTCPQAQQYVGRHPEWKHLLPGCIHFESH